MTPYACTQNILHKSMCAAGTYRERCAVVHAYIPRSCHGPPRREMSSDESALLPQLWRDDSHDSNVEVSGRISGNSSFFESPSRSGLTPRALFDSEYIPVSERGGYVVYEDSDLDGDDDDEPTADLMSEDDDYTVVHEAPSPSDTRMQLSELVSIVVDPSYDDYDSYHAWTEYAAKRSKTPTLIVFTDARVQPYGVITKWSARENLDHVARVVAMRGDVVLFVMDVTRRGAGLSTAGCYYHISTVFSGYTPAFTNVRAAVNAALRDIKFDINVGLMGKDVLPNTDAPYIASRIRDDRGQTVASAVTATFHDGSRYSKSWKHGIHKNPLAIPAHVDRNMFEIPNATPAHAALSGTHLSDVLDDIRRGFTQHGFYEHPDAADTTLVAAWFNEFIYVRAARNATHGRRANADNGGALMRVLTTMADTETLPQRYSHQDRVLAAVTALRHVTGTMDSVGPVVYNDDEPIQHEDSPHEFEREWHLVERAYASTLSIIVPATWIVTYIKKQGALRKANLLYTVRQRSAFSLAFIMAAMRALVDTGAATVTGSFADYSTTFAPGDFVRRQNQPITTALMTNEPDELQTQDMDDNERNLISAALTAWNAVSEGVPGRTYLYRYIADIMKYQEKKTSAQKEKPSYDDAAPPLVAFYVAQLELNRVKATSEAASVKLMEVINPMSPETHAAVNRCLYPDHATRASIARAQVAAFAVCHPHFMQYSRAPVVSGDKDRKFVDGIIARDRGKRAHKFDDGRVRDNKRPLGVLLRDF